jgi:hypothetical protein
MACWFSHSAKSNLLHFIEARDAEKFAMAECHRPHATGVRSPESIANATQNHAGIDSAEAEGIA